jgi:Sigma-70, region 4
VPNSPCPGQSSVQDSEALVQAETAAVEMYRFAALLLSNEAEALNLVENTVAAFDIDPCSDPVAATGLVRDRVLDGALEIMQRHDPQSFASIPASDPGSSCIEDDSTVPLSRSEISELVAGAGRGPLRDWLAHLSEVQRAVFVQRAVLGSSNADTAQALNRHSRPSIWTKEAVSTLFRQALCSLASSLVHSIPAAQL